MYAWAFGMVAAGELFTMLLYAATASIIPYTVAFLVGSTFQICGGVIHALAVEGWMIAISQFILARLWVRVKGSDTHLYWTDWDSNG